MLSGEGNAGERGKRTIGLISKKATLHVQHTFFVHFFDNGGNVVRVLVLLFSLPLIFTLHLIGDR